MVKIRENEGSVIGELISVSLYNRVPNPGCRLGTGLWPIRDWAAQQASSG